MKKLILFILSGILLNANEYENSMNLIKKTNESLENIQLSIDKKSLLQDSIIEQYKSLNIKLESLNNENKELEERVRIDNEKLKHLDNEIKNVDQTKNAILPLMDNMLHTLEKLIQIDTPFLLKQRVKRVEEIKELLQKANIPNFQKYSRIMNAYEIEYGYSNTISAYQDEINGVTYNFLRIGRVGLYYESLDKKKYGAWNSATKTWESIDSLLSQTNISKGLKIANKHISPTLLTLPFSTSKDIK